MSVFLAWTPAGFPDGLRGPWLEIRSAAPDLAVVESDASLSVVYHELKWSLPDETPLLVAPLAERPKLKGLRAGTTSWFRERLPGPSSV